MSLSSPGLVYPPGGRSVIDKVQHSLGLAVEQMEPSRMTLHRFENLSLQQNR